MSKSNMVKVVRTEYENGNTRYDLISKERPDTTMFGTVSFNASRMTGCKPEVGWSSTSTENPAHVRALANALLQAADDLEESLKD